MKPILLAALAALLMLPACQTPPTPGQLATIQTVAAEVSYVGAAYDLAENPAHRAHYVLCREALAGMVRAEDFSPEALRAALNGLPALTGASGALLDGGLTLFVLGTGFLPIGDAPRIKATVLGLQEGLTKALARPTGTATRALAAPLPRPCTVPPRRAAK